MKKKIFSTIEYILIFAALLAVGFYINRNIILKALYMDDLYAWSWIPETNFFSFCFKFYDNSTRYRPFYYVLQYIVFKLIGTNVNMYVPVNIILHTIVGFFVYYFCKKLNAGIFISFLLSLIYEISHFSYYQIGQAIGIIETEAQLFALIILYMTFIYIDTNDEKNDLLYFFILVMLFITSFTHERYIGLFVVVFLAILIKHLVLIDKNSLIKNRLIKEGLKQSGIRILFLIIDFLIIMVLRYYSIGKIVPAGTGGTYVEDTFTVSKAFQFAIDQVKFIFGMNVGPDYLVGISFEYIDPLFRRMVYLSIFMLIVIVLTYLIVKIYDIVLSIKTINNKLIYVLSRFKKDILFLVFIAMCIGSSSVTIRIEMRFVYVSFTASLLYLAYMSSEIMDISKGMKTHLMVYNVLFMFIIGFFLTRGAVEIYYRNYYKNIYFFVESDRNNSLVELTIDKYGKEKILDNNTKIYILHNNFGMTDFYAEYFYKIYDEKYIGNKINFINDLNKLPLDANKDNTFVFIEDYTNNVYKEYDVSEFLDTRNIVN